MTNNTLSNGATLPNGGELMSPNGGYRLSMQADGNLVLYARWGGGWKPLWASNTCGHGNGPFRLCMQGDNNLVVYDGSMGGGIATWSSGSYRVGRGAARLILQDDGNCVLYDGFGKALWCTRTEGPQESPYSGMGHRLW